MCFFKKKKTNKEPWQDEIQLPDMELYKQQNPSPAKDDEYLDKYPVREKLKDEHSASLNYADENTAFATSFGGYANDNSGFMLTEFGGEIEEGFRETENPTKQQLERAIKNIVFYDGDFFTLVSDDPINGFIMVGGSVLDGDDFITATAEVEITGKDDTVLYDLPSLCSAEMLELLTDFMDGRTPDIHNGKWKISEE